MSASDDPRNIQGWPRDASTSSKTDHKAVTYSLVSEAPLFGDRAMQHLRFVPANPDPAEFLVSDLSDEIVHETAPAAQRLTANRFWYVKYGEKPNTHLHAVLSTTQMMKMLDEQRTLFVISGPFATREQALYDADVRWETPE